MQPDLSARCCIAGGGPAGLVLGLLLARAGIDVVVLEKHADFLRDFRGDTVHPSTLEVMHELGLLDAFLERPHDEVRQLTASVNGHDAVIADFKHVRTRCRFIALMPQWDFLDFVRDEAQRHPGFRLLMQAECTGVLERDGLVQGVTARTAGGQPFTVRADLTVGADGRRSVVRSAAGLTVHDLGAPIDVLWMRLPRHPGDPDTTGGRISAGHFLAMLNRGSYWQCAYVIAKGGIAALQAQGLPAFREELVKAAPLFADRVQLLQSWDDVKLLSVSVDRLERWWKPGLLCIGDAAHAMSPVGGVGINLAIQDAVAAANLLATPLADEALGGIELARFCEQVQRRRLWPTQVMQRLQVTVHNRLLVPVLASPGQPSAQGLPWPLRLMNRLPWLRALPAWLVGVGVRPEHVKTPDVGHHRDAVSSGAGTG